MKFGRYLEESQIPEWRRAYINYKGLKKRISAIRAARLGEKTPLVTPRTDSQEMDISEARASTRYTYGTIQPTRVSSGSDFASNNSANKRTVAQRQSSTRGFRDYSRSNTENGITPQSETPSAAASQRFLRPGISRRETNKSRVSTLLTLEGLYSSLDAYESEFFRFLDNELEKVDSFYNEREDSTLFRLSELKTQLDELAEHRRIFYESGRPGLDTWKLPRVVGEVLGVPRLRQRPDTDIGSSSKALPIYDHNLSPQFDPAEYQQAKHRMKKALREFYRSVELLNDYRVLNLTGFRKALKKYEKLTKRPVQDLYMREKVETCRFAKGEVMDETLREIERIYTIRFENGDRKKTLKKLKSPYQHKSHYLSMFRTGIYLGLGFPALIFGIYNSFQPDVRRAISQWGPLLEIYATLMIFVVFSLLIGVNLLVWEETHINYPFIFELDVRTMVDVRKYFEFPAFLFFTLCYCVWFSFFSIGSQTISPTTWPLIWLVFALVVLVNPFPVFSRTSRYWLIKHIGRLVAPGWGPVDFADFWLGDQFCSLAFSVAHIFTIGCAYSHSWGDVFLNCGSTTHWVTLALLTTPYLSRLAQSIRRYYDSRLPTHLVNGGKYFSSIVMYVTYYAWRFNGSHRDKTFVIWCIFATIASTYTTAWDILMDWSFLQRHSKHKFLRSDLIYTNNPLIYYFAIISNIVIRFIWIIYIPSNGLNSRVRAAIAAGLEMSRRFQWNFFRLENEQVGNTDQYRATREVPLPYSSTFQQHERENDDSDGEDNHSGRSSGRMSSRKSLRMRLFGMSSDDSGQSNE